MFQNKRVGGYVISDDELVQWAQRINDAALHDYDDDPEELISQALYVTNLYVRDHYKKSILPVGIGMVSNQVVMIVTKSEQVGLQVTVENCEPYEETEDDIEFKKLLEEKEGLKLAFATTARASRYAC